MRNIFRRTALKRWAPPVSLAGLAVAVVLAAPLATAHRAAASMTIAGARSLSDKVSVAFDTAPPGHTTRDVHVLAFNDLHGNARSWRPEPVRPVRRRRSVPGEEGQGPPGAVRRLPGDGLRRRQHRREPARERALPRRADPDRDEPDARRLRLGRQPRVRQGLRRAAAHPERRLPSDRRLHGCSVCAGKRRQHEHVSRRRLPVPGGERGRGRDRQDAVPGLRDQAVQLDRRQAEVQGRLHRRGAAVDADDRDADRRRGAHVPGRGRRGEQGRRRARRQGREDPDPRDPPGRLPGGSCDAQRVRRQPRR